MQDAKRDARGLLSRGSLLGELQGKGILNLVPPEVKAIHALLEQEFNPLELCLKLVSALTSFQGHRPSQQIHMSTPMYSNWRQYPPVCRVSVSP